MNSILMTLAMATPPASEGGQGGGLQMMMPMVIIFAIFYFMLIRPQQRKEKERQKIISEAKTGDRVMFSGILGTITNVKEHTFIVKISDNTKVEVVRGAITKVLEKGEKVVEEEK